MAMSKIEKERQKLIRAIHDTSIPISGALASKIACANTDELRHHLLLARACAEAISEPLEPKSITTAPAAPKTRGPRINRGRTISIGKDPLTGELLGPHTYALAKDEWAGEEYTGPAWVPFNLWHCYKFGDIECARKLIYGAGAKRTWATIAERFERPDNIASQLPRVCADALAHWRVQPRVTPKKWKEARESLARNARQIALELERFFMPRDADANEWHGLLDFTQLLNDEELRQLDAGIRWTAFAIHNTAREDVGARHAERAEYFGTDGLAHRSPVVRDSHRIYDLLLEDHDDPYDPGCIVPTLPDMMRRIADAFEADAADPPLSRPNFVNVERNHFARALIKYFRAAGDASPTIIADVVAMFYSQGMDANEVSQLIRKTPVSGPPEAITEPETSRPK